MTIIRIKQIKSRIGCPQKQKRILDALGLRKIGRIVEHEANPTILGMAEKVKHLVEIIEFSTQNQIILQKTEKVTQVNKDKFFDLKVQLTNEYLRNGGVERIYDENLLEDLLHSDLSNPNTHTSKIKAFMNCILMNHRMPPTLSQDYITEYASFTQKDLFFDQIKIETEEQIDKLFEKYNNSNNFIFRGQREASWRLYNTMQREWLNGKYEGKKEYASVLKQMIETRKQKYAPDIKKVVGEEHIDTVNDLAILGFLQHHRCPTLLLDWTSNFLNALFFAVDGIEQNTNVKEIKDYVSVYFLHSDNFESSNETNLIDYALNTAGNELKSNLIALLAEDEENRLEMEEHFKDRDIFDRDKIFGSGLISYMCDMDRMLSLPIMYLSENNQYTGVVLSLLNNENIKAQQGCFMWNASSYKPLEVVGKESYEKQSESESYKFCDCYNINKKFAPYIKIKLEKLGIKRENIYPDTKIDAREIFNNSVKK
jgi:ribosomal protein L30